MKWAVKECEFDREQGLVRLRVEETKELWESERSPEVGAKVRCYDHTEEMIWRHLNVMNIRAKFVANFREVAASRLGGFTGCVPP